VLYSALKAAVRFSEGIAGAWRRAHIVSNATAAIAIPAHVASPLVAKPVAYDLASFHKRPDSAAEDGEGGNGLAARMTTGLPRCQGKNGLALSRRRD
jgi:hypothetical protein